MRHRVKFTAASYNVAYGSCHIKHCTEYYDSHNERMCYKKKKTNVPMFRVPGKTRQSILLSILKILRKIDELDTSDQVIEVRHQGFWELHGKVEVSKFVNIGIGLINESAKTNHEPEKDYSFEDEFGMKIDFNDPNIDSIIHVMEILHT